MKPERASDDHVKELARAELMLLLAGLLSPTGPVARASRGKSSSPAAGVAGALPSELRELVIHARLTDPEEATGRLLGIAAAFRSTDAAALEEEYTRLFDGPGLCPPTETAYIRRDKGAILADIQGFYSAFGFTLDPTSGEKADHVAAELEFVALLQVMLAQARERGEHDDAEVTASALTGFGRDHLGEWLPLFSDRLAATTALDLYRDLAALVEATWAGIACELALGGWSPDGPPPLPETGSPYECGRAADQPRSGADPQR